MDTERTGEGHAVDALGVRSLDGVLQGVSHERPGTSQATDLVEEVTQLRVGHPIDRLSVAGVGGDS